MTAIRPFRKLLATLLVLFGALAVTAGPAAAANTLPAPTGEVILTITGDLSVTNAPGEARFDLAMLRALPATEFTTSTIWTKAPIRFTGVKLKDLLAAVGAKGKTVHAVALNDYAVDLPMSEAETDAPLLAYAMNGEPMAVRDKGPLWIVYPYDDDAKYRSETVYAWSIWQLTRLDIGN